MRLAVQSALKEAEGEAGYYMGHRLIKNRSSITTTMTAKG